MARTKKLPFLTGEENLKTPGSMNRVASVKNGGCHDRNLVCRRQLHAHRLCDPRRAQFRRGNAPLACRQNAPGAAAGDGGHWAAVVVARSVASRFRRDIARGLSTADGVGVPRLLSCANAD